MFGTTEKVEVDEETHGTAAGFPQIMPHSSFCINPIQLIGGSLRLHKHVRGTDSFISKYLLVFLCVAMMLGQAASVELSPDAKERSMSGSYNL